MNTPPSAAALFNDMQDKLRQLLDQSPARDLEQNLRALMQQGFAKMDLATREQLDLQAELLSRSRAKLAELEARVAELEQKLDQQNTQR